MERKKIAIVGHGFVGKATDTIFNKNVDKFIVDPKYGNGIKDLKAFEPEFIFICVPTPMGDHGQDGKILEDVINEIYKENIEAVLIIKSTVIPANLNKFKNKFENIIYNPEFLRERHAIDDFIDSKFIILGGEIDAAKKVAELYKKNSECKADDFIFTDIEKASLVKYTVNSFLASKVLFFNQIYELFMAHGYSEKDWEEFTEIIALDKRVGSSHMSVPGHDGRKGYGGACFPKDIDALIKHADNKGINLDLLKNIQQINNDIRSGYTSITEREEEQNIKFK